MTLLIVFACIVVLLVALAFFRINAKRPKSFSGDLKPLEKSLFRELENRLPAPAGGLVTQQLNYLKQGMRLYFEKSYSLDLYDSKEKALPASILFDHRGEFKLSTLAFTAKGVKYKAEFKAHAGRVWGMSVRPNPKHILNAAIDGVDKFTLHNDPNEKVDVKIVTEFYNDTDTLDGLLGELQQSYTLKTIKKPLPTTQRQQLIKQADTKFPDDYLLLCSLTNGFELSGASVLGLGEHTVVDLEDGSHLVLAEKAGGCITIKQSSRTPELRYRAYDDEQDVRVLGNEFAKALNQFVSIA